MSLGGPSTTTTKQEPWEGLRPYLTDAYAQAQAATSTPREFFPGQTFAPRSPVEMSGTSMLEDYARNDLPTITGNINAAMTSMLNAPDVANNPYIQDAARAANQRLATDFNEMVNPQLKASFGAAGQANSSRQSLAQSMAADRLQRNMADQTAGMFSDAWSKGLDQQARGSLLAPQLVNLGMLPGQTLAAVGETDRAYQQLGINDAMQRYNFSQMDPITRAQQFSGVLGGLPSFQTTTAPNPNQSNPLASILGIGSMLMGMPMGGLGGLGGAAGGGLLSGGLSFF